MARRFFSPNDESDNAEKEEYYEGISDIEQKVLYREDTDLRSILDEHAEEEDDYDPEEEYGPEIAAPSFGSPPELTEEDNDSTEQKVIIRLSNHNTVIISKDSWTISPNQYNFGFTEESPITEILEYTFYNKNNYPYLKLVKNNDMMIINTQHIVSVLVTDKAI